MMLPIHIADDSSVSSPSDSGLPPLGRQKKWATKVRTGCLTCRSRRVKCDETKPHCKRCTSSKRECEGYAAKQPAWQRLSQPVTVVVRQPNHAVTPFSHAPSSLEMQMFDIFHKDVVPQMAGIFDQSFWLIDTMQASQIHPAIWHATIATAAMHTHARLSARPRSPGATSLISRQKGQECYILALKQYNESIKHLTRVKYTNPSPSDQEMLLMACIVFTALCSIRGDPIEASMHIQNGLDLFRQWKYGQQLQQRALTPSRPTNCILPINSLTTLFNRFELQSLNAPFKIPNHTTQIPPVVPPKFSKQPFLSSADAYAHLLPILSGFRKAARGVQTPTLHVPIPDLCEHYRQLFNHWRIKFRDLQDSRYRGKDGRVESEGVLILKMWEFCADMVHRIDLSKGELCWDEMLPEFEHIVALAARHLQIEKPLSPLSPISPGSEDADYLPKPTTLSRFSFTCLVGEPLHLVASLCRNPVTRRKAIYLLKTNPHRAGVFDSGFSVLLTEAKMQVEEDGVLYADPADECVCIPSAFICMNHRVTDISLRSYSAGVAKLTMRTVSDIRKGRPGKLVTIPWRSEVHDESMLPSKR